MLMDMVRGIYFCRKKGIKARAEQHIRESEICYLTVLNLAADARAAVLEKTT